MGSFTQPRAEFGGKSVFYQMAAQQGGLGADYQKKNNVDRFGNPLQAASRPTNSTPASKPSQSSQTAASSTVLTDPLSLSSRTPQRRTLLTA